MTAPRWPALDGLRGVAILLVLVAHSQLVPAVTAGMLGVTLFFVLSGFLITFLLLDEKEKTGRIDLTAFYARRGLRLLPALLVYLAGIAVLVSVLELEVPIWEMTWPPALYVANYVQLAGNDLFAHRHTWSLAVEEHFYLIWPILVGLGVTRKLRALLMAVGVLLVWRLGAGMINTVWAYQATDTNAYALGIGCVAAALRHREFKFHLPKRTPELGVALLVSLALIQPRDQEHLFQIGVWLPPLAALVSVVTLWAAIDSPPTFLNGKVIRWIGGISYALYLWHAPLLQIRPFIETWGGRVVAVGLSIALAWMSWQLVEGPISRSRWRRRLMPSYRAADRIADPTP